MAHDNGRVRGIPRCQASERVSDTHVEFAQALATGPMHVEIFVGEPCSEVWLMGADVLERHPSYVPKSSSAMSGSISTGKSRTSAIACAVSLARNSGLATTTSGRASVPTCAATDA